MSSWAADAGTPGGILARDFLVDELQPLAVGANTAATGDGAYLQAFPGGTNVVAIVPGTDLADEYVMVGGHYDHLGSTCKTAGHVDHDLNGATDNAAGAAVVLDIARSMAKIPEPGIDRDRARGTARRTACRVGVLRGAPAGAERQRGRPT